MKILRKMLEDFMQGNYLARYNLSQYDVKELIRIYNELLNNKKAEFINENCKNVLEKCNIKVNIKGVGWIALN